MLVSTIIQVKRMKKAWLIFALIILSSSIAYAQESQTFTVAVSPEKQTIHSNETAIFDLTIFNNGQNGNIFEVFSSDLIWAVQTDKSLFVPSRKNFHAQLIIKPNDFSQGIHSVPINIKKVGSSEFVKKTIYVEVSDFQPMNNFLPAFRGNASMKYIALPGDEISISLTVENLNRRNMNDVIIKLRSSVINKDYTTSLEPREKKSFTFRTIVDNSIPPQNDLLKIIITKSENGKDYRYETNSLQYQILPKENIVFSEEKESGFLRVEEITRITNRGNIAKNVDYSKKANFLKRLFSSVNPKATVVGGNYEWSIHVDVNEERKIVVTTNYTILAIIAIMLIVSAALYFLLRSPLSVKKHAIIISAKEGGISEMKIQINVHNRSRKKLKNISLIDLIPKIADVEKKFDPNIIAPAEIIKNDKRGTLLKWNIAELGASEEHILMYKMISKISILGGATLPVVVAKFETEDGKERTTFSNKHKVNMLR